MKYVLLPALNVSREVDLICAIQPGVLAESYTVEWEQLEPFHRLRNEMYNVTDSVISEEVPSVPTEYRCRVAIQHSSNKNMDYIARVVFQKNGENSFHVSTSVSVFYQTLVFFLTLQWCRLWAMILKMFQLLSVNLLPYVVQL